MSKEETLSFEEALKKLETSVRTLEGGDLSLDNAIKVYQEGVGLVGHCEKKLAEAKATIEKVVESSEGQKRTPFELKE